MNENTHSCEAPHGWHPAAVAAIVAALATVIWDEERGVAVLRGERAWEPTITFYSLADLHEYMYGLAHDCWSALVDLDESGWPAEEPDVREIVADAIAEHMDRIAAMGWSRRAEVSR